MKRNPWQALRENFRRRKIKRRAADMLAKYNSHPLNLKPFDPSPAYGRAEELKMVEISSTLVVDPWPLKTQEAAHLALAEKLGRELAIRGLIDFKARALASPTGSSLVPVEYRGTIRVVKPLEKPDGSRLAKVEPFDEATPPPPPTSGSNAVKPKKDQRVEVLISEGLRKGAETENAQIRQAAKEAMAAAVKAAEKIRGREI